MLRTLLVCGLLAGFCGGLLATAFAEVAGEPAVQRAIDYEGARAAAAGETPAPELVPRDLQRSVGLVTAAAVYGLAFGGLFALVFAAVYGRVAQASPAGTALWLAAAAFLVIFLVPFLKYPANPPAVGNHDTIERRTGLYFLMVWISVFAAIGAVRLRAAVQKRRPATEATLLGGALYLVLVVGAAFVLPGVHEVPRNFPAETLWRFREASVGTQLVLWTTIAGVFAFGADRVMHGRPLWSWRGEAVAPLRR